MSQGMNKESLCCSIKEFLDLQSKAPPATACCAQCGSVCIHLPTLFWLAGDEDSFCIPLPFCLRCNPQVFSGVAETNSMVVQESKSLYA